MRFSIGDKVIVSYLKDGDHRSQYLGQCFTIASINPNSRWAEKFDKPHYGVEETNCPYIFYENELDFAERCDFYSELKKSDRVVTLRAGEVEMKVRIDDWSEEIKTDALPSVTADFTVLESNRVKRNDAVMAMAEGWWSTSNPHIKRAAKMALNSVYGLPSRASGKTEYSRYIREKVLSMGHFNIQNPTEIKNVIFNDPATIVFWADGSKTVVKAHDEAFDPEKGLAMAIVKKTFGNEGNYFNHLKKWMPKEESK